MEPEGEAIVVIGVIPGGQWMSPRDEGPLQRTATDPSEACRNAPVGLPVHVGSRGL